jgi:hypothetical protein
VELCRKVLASRDSCRGIQTKPFRCDAWEVLHCVDDVAAALVMTRLPAQVIGGTAATADDDTGTVNAVQQRHRCQQHSSLSSLGDWQGSVATG